MTNKVINKKETHTIPINYAYNLHNNNNINNTDNDDDTAIMYINCTRNRYHNFS